MMFRCYWNDVENCYKAQSSAEKTWLEQLHVPASALQSAPLQAQSQLSDVEQRGPRARRAKSFSQIVKGVGYNY
jgi:hypothetical protein